ncbi:LPXTG cell wall anchor domain-containing protein [Streptococcus sp. Marseille-Q5619]|uniref:LPXTG cell wall anchor domain-containing protein n=1 Tax=Streptococcus sp. Marseille-Q5619 TaxID=2972780 RepID=UPI0021C74C63|nr:LPXTG cell wall anchor domain-containing protein [Streptococcus sp. Marseille-Q5619]
MDKKKLFTASLASVAVLGAGFLASNPSVVKAAEDTNAAAVTKEDVADYFTELEKQAEEAINKNDKIKDKEAAILAAKVAIGKEDLLKAIDEKQITPEEVLKDLAEASKTESDEADPGKYGENYAPKEVKDAKPAPGAELVRNESGEVTEVKPLNGGIDVDAQDKINKRLDEENTDVKDAEERLAAAKHDEKEAESNREEAKAAVEAAKENVKAAQEELAAATDSKSKEEAEKTLKQAEQDLKDAEEALNQADEDYYSYVADREAEEVRVLRRQIAKDKADGKDTTALEEELDIALNGVQPLVQPDLLPYIEAEQPKLPNNGGPYPGDRYIINKPTQTPASTPAGSSGSTTPSTPANETPATPAPGTDTPAAPTAETPASTAPAVAGTSQDNTYQAPAAKAEDKKELPNTGGKDNAAIASLGFLGLLLGALPFVKRKN